MLAVLARIASEVDDYRARFGSGIGPRFKQSFRTFWRLPIPIIHSRTSPFQFFMFSAKLTKILLNRPVQLSISADVIPSYRGDAVHASLAASDNNVLAISSFIRFIGTPRNLFAYPHYGTHLGSSEFGEAEFKEGLRSMGFTTQSSYHFIPILRQAGPRRPPLVIESGRLVAPSLESGWSVPVDEQNPNTLCLMFNEFPHHFEAFQKSAYPSLWFVPVASIVEGGPELCKLRAGHFLQNDGSPGPWTFEGLSKHIKSMLESEAIAFATPIMEVSEWISPDGMWKIRHQQDQPELNVDDSVMHNVDFQPNRKTWSYNFFAAMADQLKVAVYPCRCGTISALLIPAHSRSPLWATTDPEVKAAALAQAYISLPDSNQRSRDSVGVKRRRF
jgi:hypothetical protein